MNIKPPWSIIPRVFGGLALVWMIVLIFTLSVVDDWVKTEPWWIVAWVISLGVLAAYLGFTDLQIKIASHLELESVDMERLKIQRKRAIAAFGTHLALTMTFAWLSGCSPMHVEVDPTAKARIKVLAVESQVGDNCDFLGGMSAAFNAPLVSFEENVVNAQNDLINRAAESGATHLLLGEPQVDLGGSFVQDQCVHCVVMDAKAFSCK